MRRLLPIGTVVMIDLDKKEKVMIIGRLVKKNEEELQYSSYASGLKETELN